MQGVERAAGRGLLVAALAAAAVLPAAGAAATTQANGTTYADVVVQATTDGAEAAQAVRAAGGTVTVELPIVDGVAARVPTAALDDLASAPGVLAVTPNSRVTRSADGRSVVRAVLNVCRRRSVA